TYNQLKIDSAVDAGELARYLRQSARKHPARAVRGEYVAIATGGNQSQLSANGDAVWGFSLKVQLGLLWPPAGPQSIAGPTGPIADAIDKINIGANNVEYSYGPARTRVKAGTAVTFTNVGDVALHGDGVREGQLGYRGIGEGSVEDPHLRRARQLLLHLHATSVDVRAGHRRVANEDGRVTESADAREAPLRRGVHQSLPAPQPFFARIR